MQSKGGRTAGDLSKAPWTSEWIREKGNYLPEKQFSSSAWRWGLIYKTEETVLRKMVMIQTKDWSFPHSEIKKWVEDKVCKPSVQETPGLRPICDNSMLTNAGDLASLWREWTLTSAALLYLQAVFGGAKANTRLLEQPWRNDSICLPCKGWRFFPWPPQLWSPSGYLTVYAFNRSQLLCRVVDHQV